MGKWIYQPQGQPFYGCMEPFSQEGKGVVCLEYSRRGPDLGDREKFHSLCAFVKLSSREPSSCDHMKVVLMLWGMEPSQISILGVQLLGVDIAI